MNTLPREHSIDTVQPTHFNEIAMLLMKPLPPSRGDFIPARLELRLFSMVLAHVRTFRKQPASSGDGVLAKLGRFRSVREWETTVSPYKFSECSCKGDDRFV